MSKIMQPAELRDHSLMKKEADRVLEPSIN
jgi:hypothetical protein